MSGKNRIRRYMEQINKAAGVPKLIKAAENQFTTEHGKFVVVDVLGYKKALVLHHASMRMKERGVSWESVLEVLSAPTTKNLKTVPGRKRWRKKIAGKEVDVVFLEQPNFLVIFTVIKN